ncbi:MAG TPA: DUF134 domain-containing protein [Clostridiaceae bacterium]|nr:DUF134 domain-containing protein [Clostridiaceae bacterium]
MARPMKWRRVCQLPENSRFGPLGAGAGSRERIIMTVDEYESIRLIDWEGYTQEECAAQMGIARTTVQSMYAKARRKIADSIIHGKVLIIEGGEYRLCDTDDVCGPRCLHQGRGRHGRQGAGRRS